MRCAVRPVWSPPTSAFARFRFPPGHRGGDPLVPAVQPDLPRRRRAAGQARCRGRPRDGVRWVQRFTPLLADAARFARHAPGDRWFVDETYVRINGAWRYVYRAIDQYGHVVDVLVSARRDAATARRFFQRALAVLKVTRSRSSPTRRRSIPPSLRSYSRRRGITSNSMPTIRSRPITAGSRTGSDRCAGCAQTRLRR